MKTVIRFMLSVLTVLALLGVTKNLMHRAQGETWRFGAGSTISRWDRWDLEAPLFSSEFQKGFTYLKWGSQFPEHAERSFRALKETGTEWVAFVPVYYMDSTRSLEITPHPVLSPTDDELIRSIRQAQAMGYRILLKPHIDVMKDPWKEELKKGKEAWLSQYRRFIDANPISTGSVSTLAEAERANWFRQLFTWRGEIHAGNDAGVARWFEAYQAYILRFARIAEELKVDQFCVGTELEKVRDYQGHWARVISAVRAVYRGSVFYDTNHNSVEEVKFWHLLDYVGISAYYPLSFTADPSEAQMRVGLGQALGKIERFTKTLERKHGRAFPVLFSEAGYTDFRGTSVAPWDFLLTRGFSPAEQARAYKVTLDEYAKRPWLKGVFFWRWSVEPEDRYFDYDHYSPYGKPAESVIRSAWLKRW